MRRLSAITRSPRSFIFWASALAAAAWAVYQAIALRWVCDDAFITFRYVDNFLAGKGLVYNAGERVEGYTHFLWVWLLTAGRAARLDPVPLSQTYGLVFYVALLALATGCSLALFRSRRPLVSFTALALALHHEMHIWATGGLETMLCALEILLGFFFLAIWKSPRPSRFTLAGCVFTLALLTRPDAVVFALTALVFLVLSRPPPRALRSYLAPFLILIPYALWKVAYYGQILPNTYYAKSGGLAYYSQGFKYLWIYFRPYTTSLLAFAAIPLVFWRARLRTEAGWRDRLAGLLQDPWDGPLILALAFLLAYLLLFVARVGGDFMYARFLIPILPLVYLILELLAYRLLERRPRPRTALLLLLPLLLFVERRQRDAIYFQADGEPRSAFGRYEITDEHWYYTHQVSGLTLIDGLRMIGTQLRSYFEGCDVRVLLRGQAALGYYGEFPVCLEDAGLTDRTIAHLPLHGRGRPGHEKSAPPAYLEERGIHFVFQKPPYLDRSYRFARFLVEGQPVRAEILFYDRALMRRLRERFPEEILFADFEIYLDKWIEKLPSLPPEQARREFAEFDEYYFRHNQDPERRNKILAYLGHFQDVHPDRTR